MPKSGSQCRQDTVREMGSYLRLCLSAYFICLLEGALIELLARATASTLNAARRKRFNRTDQKEIRRH